MEKQENQINKLSAEDNLFIKKEKLNNHNINLLNEMNYTKNYFV